MLSAQNLEWFETGATWVCSYGSANGPGEFQSSLQITEQTTFNGQECAKMEIASNSTGGLFSCMPEAPPFYFYEEEGKVFFATEAIPEFRLGLDFEAEAGDHWYIPLTVIDGGEMDSLRIDVIARELITLNGQELVSLSVISSNAQDIFLDFQPLTIVEKMGSLTYFAIPYGIISVCDGTTSEQLQCFTSGDFVYTAPGFSSCALSAEMPNAATGSIKIYPNPSSGIFIYETVYEIDALRVFDQIGREMENFNITNGGGLEIDLSHLNPGMYYAVFYTEQGNVVKKVVVR